MRLELVSAAVAACTSLAAWAGTTRVTFDDVPAPICENEAGDYLGTHGFKAIGMAENSVICIGTASNLGVPLTGCSSGFMLMQRVSEGVFCNDVVGCRYMSVPSSIYLKFREPIARISFCRPGCDENTQLPSWNMRVQKGARVIDAIREDAPAAGEMQMPVTYELAGSEPFTELVITTEMLGDTGGVVIDDLDFDTWCAADFNNSGGTPDSEDVSDFFAAWLSGSALADVDGSGGTPDSNDIGAFFEVWLAGGCDAA